MSFSTENERFFGLQGGSGKIAAGIASSYFEDDFGADNAAGRKKSRLNAKGILLGVLRSFDAKDRGIFQPMHTHQCQIC